MKRIILDNQKYIQSLVIKKRDFEFDNELLKLHKFICFVGGRRVGKTHIMIHTAQELVKNGEISYEDIVFIDFNEIIERTFDFKKLLSDYLSIFPYRKPFFIFDEIQEIDNFQTGLFYLYNKGYSVFISGSNSKLLSSELSTHFRGKVYEYHIQPLSLLEYLGFQDVDIKEHLSTSEQSVINKLTEDYIHYGGYPEIALLHNPYTKLSIAKNYIDVMIYKDILERYKLENEYAVKYCIKRMLESSAKELSVHKIYKDLKSQNVSIGINTLYDIIQYLQNVFFIDLVENIYSPKGQKKIFPIDTIYHNIYGKNTDIGQKFETMTYRTLSSFNNSKIFYKKHGGEIDFWNEEIGDIQVCYDLNYDNIKRELQGFQNKGIMITGNKPDYGILKTCKERNIQTMNIYQFCLFIKYKNKLEFHY